jgi:hypothetical protein
MSTPPSATLPAGWRVLGARKARVRVDDVVAVAPTYCGTRDTCHSLWGDTSVMLRGGHALVFEESVDEIEAQLWGEPEPQPPARKAAPSFDEVLRYRDAAREDAELAGFKALLDRTAAPEDGPSWEAPNQ